MPNLEPQHHEVTCLSPSGLHRMGYWSWGHPSADQVVVCVHGLTRQGRDFDTLARRLAERAWVICPDVVGRGTSDRLADPAGYAVPQYVADMVTLVARLGVGQVDWVGTSMGGLIGMGLASLPRSPIRRLVLNDVGPRLAYSALQRIGAYVGLPISWATPEEAAAALWAVSSGFGPHTPEQWMALTRPQLVQTPEGRWASRYDPAIAHNFKQISPEWAEASEAALWSAYDRIACATLLLRGRDSDLLTADTAEAMTARGPRARCITFDGVGHAPTLIAPDQVKAVTDFLWADG